MEILEAIYQRRAVRHFTSAEVSDALLRQVLQAAVQAPSPLNLQPWSFAIFSGHRRLADYSKRIKDHLLLTLPPLYQLHEHTDRMNDPGYDVFHGAPTLIVVCAKPEGHAPEESCALAAQNLMLAAHALGLGTCPVGFVRSWLKQPHIREELGIVQPHNPVFPIVVGHPAAHPAAVARREPEILVWDEAHT